MKNDVYCKERLREIDHLLLWSAKVFNHVGIDDLAQHAQERLDLLKEKRVLIAFLEESEYPKYERVEK